MLNQAQNRISGQTRILNLRDDPLAAAHSTRYQSYLARLERFSDNIEYVQGNYHIVESHIRQAVEIMHRVRELGIQGSNGIYTVEDRRAMAIEIDQLLRELVEIANARGAEGMPHFAGSSANTAAWRTLNGTIDGESMIATVEYLGNIQRRSIEVFEGSYIDLDLPGNRLFWAENQQLFSSIDATGYRVLADTAIFIDDVEIALSAGDSAFAIISKINDSGAAVEARLDPVTNGLVLETTTPHQLWLRDSQTGVAVLEDLGILARSTAVSAPAIAPDADLFGGSLFDMVIRMRDALFADDTRTTGGDALRGIDSALNNLLSNLGELGAQDARLRVVYANIENQIPEVTQQNSLLVDPDIAEAITELRILEQTHQAALSISARILPQTLLDFLR